jgi:acyl carrier protein
MVRSIVEEAVLTFGPAEIEENDDLLDLGLVDSLGVVRIVTALEDRLGLAIPDRDITHANFGSLCAIADYAARRGGA